jgi:hypothetical protein
MNPLALSIFCVVLCPVWWQVAMAAEKLQTTGDPKARALARALYRAAGVTVFVLALVAAAGVYRWAGLSTDGQADIGLM